MDQLEQWRAKLQEAAAETYPENKLVFGEGETKPRLMMIGEAPGGDEERLGRPFVGKAGKNLSSFLETVGLQREEIYITNVVKLRPTKINPKSGRTVNRPPSASEVEFFLPYLKEEIKLIAPEWIVTLGSVPLRAVTGEKQAVIGDYHGKASPLENGATLFALYHPAAIIYNPDLSAIYQQDLQALRTALGQ